MLFNDFSPGVNHLSFIDNQTIPWFFSFVNTFLLFFVNFLITKRKTPPKRCFYTSDPGRQTAVRAAREWGKVVFVGEGSTLSVNPSPDMMHPQKTVFGSWVTSTWKMMDLVERLVRWGIHPGDLITDEFPIEKADAAYALMAGGKCGKVAVVFPCSR